MKRLISLLLCLALLLGGNCVFAEEAENLPKENQTEENQAEEYSHEELRVGNPTPMDGKFFTGLWGNSTTDIDVRSIVNSYYLTVWGYDTGIFRENKTVVSSLNIAEDTKSGDRTYLVTLYRDLFYSDGSPITAWDYAFSVLFQIDPVIAELGGVPLDMSYFDGYKEYISGERPYLSGIRILNDYMIEFSVNHEYLPYFFELFRIGILPYPIHEIAPGCKVYDDGQGVYIGNEDKSIAEPLFTKELLEATVMDPDTGYLSHPTVGSGPYVLTSWDGESCTFEINPYFKGDEDGNKPSIPKIHFTLAKNEDMIQKLEERECDLLNKVTREDTILSGLQLVSGPFAMQNYPRIGLTFIVFTPDRKALQEKNVRKAINYCMDTTTIVRDYTSGFGIQMDIFAGVGQWMYSIAQGSLDYPISVELTDQSSAADKAQYEKEYAEWEAITLDNVLHYDLNVDHAIRLLEENGWTLNAQGGTYTPGVDEYRCKMIDGELVALNMTCAYPETNRTAVSMETLFIPYLEEAGIKLTLIPMDMKTLLRSYNDRDIEQIDMFYLGDDFNIEFDPQLFFLPGDPTAPEEDNLAWVHAQMYEYARLMCETDPHDTLGFMRKWVTFQEKFSDMLPMIPIYSNVYFDFYTKELLNYEIRKPVTWGDAIVPASMGLFVLEQEAAEAAAAAAGEEEAGSDDFETDDFETDDFDDDSFDDSDFED